LTQRILTLITPWDPWRGRLAFRQTFLQQNAVE